MFSLTITGGTAKYGGPVQTHTETWLVDDAKRPGFELVMVKILALMKAQALKDEIKEVRDGETGQLVHLKASIQGNLNVLGPIFQQHFKELNDSSAGLVRRA